MQYIIAPLTKYTHDYPRQDAAGTRLYAIISAHDGLALSKDEAGGIAAVQANWNESADQQWTFTWKEDGFAIKNVGSGQVLESKDGGLDSSTAVVLGQDNGALTQRWQLATSDGKQTKFKLLATNGAKVIQLRHNSNDSGVPVMLGNDSGHDYETWYILAIIRPPNTSEIAVKLYSHNNYSGTMQTVSIGAYDRGQLLENDSLSAMKIPQGLRVTTFVDKHFRGTQRQFNGDVAELPSDSNNQISSLIVERVVTTYSQAQWKGSSTTFGIGRYAGSYLGAARTGFQSIRVPHGMIVTVYTTEDLHPNDETVTYLGDVVDLGILGPRIKSLIVKQMGIAIPRDVLRYGGAVTLRSQSTGKFLIPDPDDKTTRYDVDANGAKGAESARFTIIRAGQSAHTSMVAYGDVVALRSSTGNYLVATGDSESKEVKVKGGELADEARWILVRSGATESNMFAARADMLSFKSVKYQTYLHVRDATNVTSSSTNIDDHDRFSVDGYSPIPIAAGASATGPCLGAVCGANVCTGDACAADACGAAACAYNANLISACGAAAAGIAICAVDLAILSACVVDATFIAGACGADVCGAAACGAEACGAAACGAAACGADACGAAASGLGAPGASACGAAAGGIDLCGADACGANFCGINLCPADACAADACPIDIIPIIPGI